MHRTRRRLLALLCLGAITLAGIGYYIWQERTSLIRASANAALAPYDMQLTGLRGLRLGSGAARINYLELTHQPSGKQQILRDITATFNATELVRGQLDTINIASAELDFPAALLDAPREVPASENERPPLRQLEELVLQLPFRELQIHRISFRSDESPVQLVAELNLGLRVDSDAADFTLDAALTQLEITAASWQHELLELKNLDLKLENAAAQCQQNLCQFRTGFVLELEQLHSLTSNLNFAQPQVSAEQPVSASLDLSSGEMSLRARELTLHIPALRAEESLTGFNMRVQRLDARYILGNEIDLSALYLHSEFSVTQLYTNLIGINLWPLEFAQTLTLDGNEIALNLNVMLPDLTLATSRIQYNLENQRGRAISRVPPITFNDSSRKLSDLVSPLPSEMDVIAGTVSGEADWQWRFEEDSGLRASGPLSVSLQGLSGYINDIAFVDASTAFRGDLLPDWGLRNSRDTLTIASLDAGIEIANISSDYRIDTAAGSVALMSPRLEVFGGRVSSEGLEYHLEDNDSRFTVNVDRINLAQVLSMSAYDAVTANGLVSGRFPVRLQGVTPSIAGGTLAALPPGGSIRYGSGDAGANNQRLELVYQALEHYEFNLFEADVDYLDSGELELAIRMQGISPGLNDGQRINLNLNISDDIPALLQSLQAARNVSDAIQARLEAR